MTRWYVNSGGRLIWEGREKGKRRGLISYALGKGCSDTYGFVHKGIVLGVDLPMVGIQLLLIDLSQVEEVARFELVVPCSTCGRLVEQEGFFAIDYGPVLVVLYLPEKRGEDFGVSLRPTGRDEPPAKEVVGVHKLLPCELLI